jgi:O-acetylhomoserine/O-acetylserine sulfhydrylase-like pyridoxal-dependent enzyme
MNQERPFARVYTRLGNPTTEALETVIHDLECGYGDKYVMFIKPRDSRCMP